MMIVQPKYVAKQLAEEAMQEVEEKLSLPKTLSTRTTI